MTKLVLGALTLLFALTAAAADPASPAGLWKTVDDKTKLDTVVGRLSYKFDSLGAVASR